MIVALKDHFDRVIFQYSGCLLLFLFMSGSFALTIPAYSQDWRANPDSALQVKLAQIGGEKIRLERAVSLALENASAVREARARLRAAQGAVRREKGSFDPELFLSLERSGNDTPTASLFSGASILETRETAGRAGVRINLPIGTEIEASLNSTRLETNSRYASLSPQYTAFGNLTFRQPLTSGFRASGRKFLSSAERALDAARTRFEQQVLGTTAAATRSYWDLYAAERNYAVQQVIRDRAEALLEETQVRARTGLVGPGQVANARVFLAEQELALLDREEELDRLSDTFASLIGKRPEDEKIRYVVVDEPPHDFPLESVETLVTQSRENSLSLQALRREIESLQVLARAARWEALPDLDLFGAIGGNGLSGEAQEVESLDGTVYRTDQVGDLGEALSQVGSRDYPSWRVGVELSLPIGGRSGGGERDRLRAQVMEAEARYLSAARLLEEQVRAAHRELYNGRRRLALARNGVEAAQEQVRIGQIEYRNGRSTAFELVRLGADFAVAQQRYSRAVVLNARAAATLTELTSGGYPAVSK